MQRLTRLTKRQLAVLLALVILTLLVAVPASAESPQAIRIVAIVDFDFMPPTRTIAIGDRIVWRNFGSAPHTVTSSDGLFDSGALNAGQLYTRVFTSAGTYEYLCTIHPSMTASIVVQ